MKITLLLATLIPTYSFAAEMLVRVTYQDQEVKEYAVPTEDTELPLKLKLWKCNYSAQPMSSGMGLSGHLSCMAKNGKPAFFEILTCYGPDMSKPHTETEAELKGMQTIQYRLLGIRDSIKQPSIKVEVECKLL